MKTTPAVCKCTHKEANKRSLELIDFKSFNLHGLQHFYV